MISLVKGRNYLFKVSNLRTRDFKMKTLTLTLTLTINIKVNVLYFLIKCLSLKTATLQNKFSPMLQI